MSLLLDALKDADHRHRDQAAARPIPTGNAPPPVDEAAVLSILEDSRPKPGLAHQNAGSPRNNERVAQRSEKRSNAATPKPTKRRYALPTLLALICVALGAAYFLLNGRSKLEPLIAAPLTGATLAAPIPVEAATLPTTLPAPPTEAHIVPEPRLVIASRPRMTARQAIPAAPAVAVATDPNEAPALPPGMHIERSAAPEGASTLQQAFQALRSGDLHRASALYEQTLQAEPHQVDAHLGLAALAQARGDRSVALRHYRQVLDLVPDQPRAWAGLADLAGPDAMDAVESRLRSLIASRPDASLHFALGNIMARQSRWPEAQESYFSAFSGVPDNPDYAYNLAVALDHLGKPAAAAQHYESALRLAAASTTIQFDRQAASQRLAVLNGARP